MKNILLYENALEKCLRKSEGDFMNSKLYELNGRTPEEILRNTGQLYAIPVDIGRILVELDIKCIMDDMTQIEEIEQKGHVAGLVLLHGNDVGIFYNRKDDTIQQRFTIAHELAHCCLHGDLLNEGYVEFLHKDGFENEHEKVASVYASKILIPTESLINVYNRLLLPTLTDLAMIFEVPKFLMKRRLEELSLTYYSDDGRRSRS